MLIHIYPSISFDLNLLLAKGRSRIDYLGEDELGIPREELRKGAKKDPTIGSILLLGDCCLQTGKEKGVRQ